MMTPEEFAVAFPGFETVVGIVLSLVVFAISFWIGHKMGGGGA